MKKYLERISAACGIPDASEACRVILQLVKEAENELNTQQINVRVSGSDIYKAVSNYMRHSEDLKFRIKGAMEKVVTSEVMENAIRKTIHEHLFASYSKTNKFEDEMKKEVKKEVQKILKEDMLTEDLIKTIVGNTLKKLTVG